MDLKEWRARRLIETVLPSGLTVTLRCVNIVDLAASGQLPLPLVGAVEEMFNASALPDPQSILANVEMLVKIMPAFDAVAVAALVRPHVGDDPLADDVVALAELSTDDKNAIFVEATKGVARIAPLFPGPGPDQDPGGAGTAVPPATVDDVGA